MFDEEYDTEEAIPAAVRHLFKSDGERYVLIPANEIKSVDDVSALQKAAAKERADHKLTKQALAQFSGLDADEVREKLDRVAELEAQIEAGGGDDSEARSKAKEQAVEIAQLKSQLGTREREMSKLSEEFAERQTTLAELESRDRHRRIADYARQAAKEANLSDTGVNSLLLMAPHWLEETDDGQFVTRDGVAVPGANVTPGVTLDVALTEVQRALSGWWPESKGGGTRGNDGTSGGANPWRDGEKNMTEMGRIYKEDPARAERLARAAGKKVDGSALDSTRAA